MPMPKYHPPGADPTGPPGTGGNPGKGPHPTGTTKKKNTYNPALITSTGGLQGVSGDMLTPAFNPTGNGLVSYVIKHDPFNFSCEEDAEYDFRQEVGSQAEGQNITINKIVLKYRELGKASFNINITVFDIINDVYNTVVIPVLISKKKGRTGFPDNRIHTKILTPPRGAVQGERPQASLTYGGSSGPVSVTKLVLCGYTDEIPQI